MTLATTERCFWCGNPLSETPQAYCGRKDSHVCGKRHGTGIERCELSRRECKQERLADKARRLEVAPQRIRMTALDIEKAIRKYHAPRSMHEQPQWLLLTEFTIGGRRLDAYAINLWTGYRRGPSFIGYEIKVDRADFVAELRTPAKRAPGMAATTQFYFAAPQGLIKPEEVPEGCGLVEAHVGARGAVTIRETLPAERRPTPEIRDEILVALARRLAGARDPR